MTAIRVWVSVGDDEDDADEEGFEVDIADAPEASELVEVLCAALLSEVIARAIEDDDGTGSGTGGYLC